jgi:hypothetical protein
MKQARHNRIGDPLTLFLIVIVLATLAFVVPAAYQPGLW